MICASTTGSAMNIQTIDDLAIALAGCLYSCSRCALGLQYYAQGRSQRQAKAIHPGCRIRVGGWYAHVVCHKEIRATLPRYSISF